MSTRGKINHAEAQWAHSCTNLNTPAIKRGKLKARDFDPAPRWLLPAYFAVVLGVSLGVPLAMHIVPRVVAWLEMLP